MRSKCDYIVRFLQWTPLLCTVHLFPPCTSNTRRERKKTCSITAITIMEIYNRCGWRLKECIFQFFHRIFWILITILCIMTSSGEQKYFIVKPKNSGLQLHKYYHDCVHNRGNHSNLHFHFHTSSIWLNCYTSLQHFIFSFTARFEHKVSSSTVQFVWASHQRHQVLRSNTVEVLNFLHFTTWLHEVCSQLWWPFQTSFHFPYS